MNKSTRLLNLAREVVKCRFYSNPPKNWNDHPYSKVHPWNSEREFSRFLLNNVIYNDNGLVAINKPYGISLEPPADWKKKPEEPKNVIKNAKEYTIQDSLNYLAKELDYPSFKIIKAPEKFISGVTLLAASKKAEDRIIKSLRRKYHEKINPAVYWIVTTKLPREINGKKTLGLTMEKHSLDSSLKGPVFITDWSKKKVQRAEVYPIHIDFKLISNSRDNLASLIELTISKRKWHSIRLFATQILHAPILGDNVTGFMIQKVMESYVNVGNFSELKGELPKLNPDLLGALKVRKHMQCIIPCHIHLRRMHLFDFSEGKDLVIEAPLMPEFQYTCDQLKFKHISPEDKTEESEETLHEIMEESASRI